MYSLAVASGLSLFSFFSQAESLEDKNMAKVQHSQLEKLKSQYDRLTEELTQNENENKKLKLKYQCLKDQLEEKVKMWMNSNLKDFFEFLLVFLLEHSLCTTKC